MAIFLPLFVVVCFDDGENAAEFVFEAIDGFGGVMTPFRRVILSRRLMSILYAPNNLDGDMLALVHLG